MARRRKVAAESESATVPEPILAQPESKNEAEQLETKSRPDVLALRVVDGKIDFASMRPSTREKFFSVLRASDVEAPGEVAAGFKPEDVAPIYHVLGGIEAWIASKRGYPQGLCSSVFRYSDAEINILSEPTAAVLNKHVSANMLKWKDEVSLVSILLVLHQAKISRLNEAMKLIEENRKQEAARNQEASTAPSNSESEEVAV